MSDFDYSEIKAFSETLDPKKNAARYKMHRYFTRRPFNVIQEYIKHYTKEGDVVLDPFLGSGVTVVEALILRRKAIGIDIESLSTFISKNVAVSPVNILKFEQEFRKIKTKYMNQIYDLYKLNNREVDKLKIPYWYPKNVELPSNADVKTVDELFTKRQLISLSILFNEIKKIQDKTLRELMKLVFSSTLTFTNKMYDRGSSSPFAVYRYWMPKKLQEVNVWDYFERRYEAVKKGKIETNDLINNFYKNNCKIYTDSATELTKYVKNNSVDYIFTDPPYGAHIAYIDLSIMWDSWLGFNDKEKKRANEIIEKGNLNKTREDYIHLLRKSFEQMYKVLKENRWMSLVFHHKELKLWRLVKDACEDAGFEYINAVSQPITKMPTLHKIQSPLRTMAGELILNFKKSKIKNHTKISAPSTIKNVVLNVAERVILQKEGATTDDIYHVAVPELLDANLLDKAVKEVNDITPILEKEFELDENGKWQIKKGTKLGSWIPQKDRIRFYATSYLKREKKATTEEIITTLLPLLSNGHRPENKDILETLEEVAEPEEGKYWKLKEKMIKHKQATLLDHVSGLPYINFKEKDEKKTHNLYIYALANLAKLNGYKVWIGKKEQSQKFNNIKLYDLCNYDELPLLGIKDDVKKIIQQIDIMWFENDQPIAAFEIENTTNVQRGILRFVNLIKKEPDISSKLYLVAPKKRENKVKSELGNPVFIGEPLYLEKKVKYLLYLDIEKIYKDLQEENRIKFKLMELDRLAKGILSDV